MVNDKGKEITPVGIKMADDTSIPTVATLILCVFMIRHVQRFSWYSSHIFVSRAASAFVLSFASFILYPTL